jgi:hypothetical protein
VQRAQLLFTELLSATESADKASYGEYVKTMIEYKIEWEREIERCNQIGVPGPEPLPHPDDIIIDMRNGGVRVLGPWTKEEKVVWDKLRRELDESVESIRELKELAADPESESFRHIVVTKSLSRKRSAIASNGPSAIGQKGQGRRPADNDVKPPREGPSNIGGPADSFASKLMLTFACKAFSLLPPVPQNETTIKCRVVNGPTGRRSESGCCAG